MRLLAILLFLTWTTSCKKVVCEDSEKSLPVNATVEWAGAPEADGIGWILRLEDGQFEKPSNLDDQFKSNNLKVSVRYEKTNERYPCFCVGNYIEMVRIVSINRR